MKQGKLSLLLIFAFGFVILVTGGVPAVAQTTTRGSIVGATVGPTGAVGPNATVGIVNNATSIATTIAGDSTGNFVALLLVPGTNTVTINAPGFDFPKQVIGSSESVVKVSAEEPIMNFVSLNFSSVINSAELKNLPINNRRWSARASDKNNIGPRVGFAYDVLGTGKMVVRGGYGPYYGRITNGNEGVALATIGSPLGQSATKVTSSQGLAEEPVFPYRFSSASGCRAHRTRG